MMYPKKQQGSFKQSQSRKFLNPGQRDDLKKVVAERLSKKYGLKYTELIQNEVDQFINRNQNITAAGLQDLENNIQRATKPQQVSTQGRQYQRDDDEQSVKSGISKMSGASHFDAVDKYTVKALTKQEAEEQEKYKGKKLQTVNIEKMKNDLNFLEEENEWAAIYKYNKYLYDKEQDALQEKQKEQKVKNRRALDQQLQEKEGLKKKEQDLDKEYAQHLELQMTRFDQKEKEKEEEKIKLRLLEKDARNKQIRENKYRRKHEDKQQKALDSYLMQKVREELEQEQKFQQFKKEHQAQVMHKLLEDNEVRKQAVMESEEQERQENINLMNAYSKLISDQEKEREDTLKLRDQKMKEFQSKALEQVQQDFEDKLGKMEARRDRYEKRHERKLQEEETKDKQKIVNGKQDMKEYLFKQMEEKKQRQAAEKVEYNSQAKIWNDDNKKYSEFETQKNYKKREIMTNYASTLKQQMADNQSQKQNNTNRMDENEAYINKFLLDELDQIRIEKDAPPTQ